MPMMYDWVIAALTREESFYSGVYQAEGSSMGVSEGDSPRYGDQSVSDERLAKVDDALRNLAQVLTECGYTKSEIDS